MWMAAWLASALVSMTPAEASVLRWQAPAEVCPSQGQVSAQLESLLGSRTLALRARADVRRHDAGWRAQLRVTWNGRTDTRTLDAADCNALANAITLLVAVMGDPLAVADSIELPAVASSSLPSPPPSTETNSVVRTETAAPPPSGHSSLSAAAGTPPPAALDRGFSLQTAAWGDIGSLSRIAAGASLGIAWRRPRWRARIEALYLPPQRISSTEPEAGQGRIQVAALRGGACARLGSPTVEVPLCALAEAGAIAATRFGPAANLRAGNPWVAAGAGMGVHVRLSSRWALFSRLEAMVPLAPRQYRHAELLLYQTAPVTARAAFGVEFRWAGQFSAEPGKTPIE